MRLSIKHFLFFFIFIASYLHVGAQTITDNLELYYDFSNSSSYSGTGTTINDLSGNNYHATANNGPTKVTGGILLDGVNDYIRSNSALPLMSNNTSSFTIEVVVTPKSTKGNILLVSNSSSGDSSWNMPPIASANNKFYTQVYSNNVLESSYTTNSKYTITLVFTYNASAASRKQELFINGTLIASQSNISFNSSTFNNYFFLGRKNDGCCNTFSGVESKYFNGIIHSFAFYSKALNATEVQDSHNGYVKTNPVISGFSNLSMTYGDAEQTQSVSSTSTSTLSFTSSNTAIAEINGTNGTVTPKNVGTTTLWVYQAANDTHFSGLKSSTITIAKKTISFSGITASDKVYDGTTAAATATNTIVFTGLVGSDQVLVNPTGAFDNSNVGVSKTVSLTYTYSGSEVSRYTITGQATTTASITAKPITLIPTASQSKTYGEANAPLTYTVSPSTLPNGTTITLGGTLSRTLGENVGTYSITIGTVSNTNYNITLSPETFEITKKTITVSGITANDKVYDANTNASVDLSGITFTGKETGDTITATVTGTFDTKDIGTAKTVSLSATYSSSALENYTIVDQNSTTASITAKTVSVTGSTGLNKTYDGNTNLPLGEIGYGSLTGVIGSEDVSLTGVGVYDAASVGSRTIAIGTVTLTGADKDNYSLLWTNGSGTISKKTLTVTANNDAKFVTESDTPTYNGVSYSGFEGSDSVADITTTGLVISRTASSTNITAGSYPATLVPSGLPDATNYDFNYIAGDYTIVAADKLLLNIENITTTYGSSATYTVTSAQYYKSSTSTVVTLVNPNVNGDGIYPLNDGSGVTIGLSISPSGPITTSAGKLAVGNYPLTASVVSGTSVNFNNVIEVVGNHSVAKKGLSASASSVSKEYDATTGMSGVSLGLTGLESSDEVTVNGTGAFSSPSAGTGLSYTIAGLSLAGADADNYYLS
ncbi:MAG: YDG domain-containing protein, partial [Flavobacteriaceae bacterium]|nr:YDG domain-containing protein [Flavobacteriaceae bacterium]MCI5087770.1 YDG domain-containing protein [Flavobacteriaceae bacterium]